MTHLQSVILPDTYRRFRKWHWWYSKAMKLLETARSFGEWLVLKNLNDESTLKLCVRFKWLHPCTVQTNVEKVDWGLSTDELRQVLVLEVRRTMNGDQSFWMIGFCLLWTIKWIHKGQHFRFIICPSSCAFGTPIIETQRWMHLHSLGEPGPLAQICSRRLRGKFLFYSKTDGNMIQTFKVNCPSLVTIFWALSWQLGHLLKHNICLQVLFFMEHAESARTRYQHTLWFVNLSALISIILCVMSSNIDQKAARLPAKTASPCLPSKGSRRVNVVASGTRPWDFRRTSSAQKWSGFCQYNIFH